jgi:hypothetical protein
VATPVRPPGFLRWAPLGGIVYVVLFVVGTILMVGDNPAGDAPPGKVIAYFQDSGHRDKIHLGWFAILFAVFFLLWFVASLRELVRGYAGDGVLLTVTTVGGAIYAATTLVSFSLEEGILTMSDDTYHHAVDPLVIHGANDAGYTIHSAGGTAIAAMMIATTLAALRARAMPGWLAAISILAGVIAIFSIFFFPWFVIALWLIVASVLVTRAFGRVSAGVAPG